MTIKIKPDILSFNITDIIGESISHEFNVMDKDGDNPATTRDLTNWTGLCEYRVNKDDVDPAGTLTVSLTDTDPNCTISATPAQSELIVEGTYFYFIKLTNPTETVADIFIHGTYKFELP